MSSNYQGSGDDAMPQVDPQPDQPTRPKTPPPPIVAQRPQDNPYSSPTAHQNAPAAWSQDGREQDPYGPIPQSYQPNFVPVPKRNFGSMLNDGTNSVHGLIGRLLSNDPDVQQAQMQNQSEAQKAQLAEKQRSDWMNAHAYRNLYGAANRGQVVYTPDGAQIIGPTGTQNIPGGMSPGASTQQIKSDNAPQTPFGEWRSQNPGVPISEWFKIQSGVQSAGINASERGAQSNFQPWQDPKTGEVWTFDTRHNKWSKAEGGPSSIQKPGTEKATATDPLTQKRAAMISKMQADGKSEDEIASAVDVFDRQNKPSLAAGRQLANQPAGQPHAPLGQPQAQVQPAQGGNVVKSKSKSGKPITSNDGGKTWVYD